MTNYEFYKDQIWEYILKDKMFAMRCGSDALTTCSHLRCDECVFSRHNGIGGTGCADNRMLWAMQEHIEKPKLTKQERKFCELLKEKDCWFARDLDETLCVFLCKPHKIIADGMWYDDDLGTTLMTSDQLSVFEVTMPFIKWQDEEPWSVDALLELEVEDGD